MSQPNEASGPWKVAEGQQRRLYTEWWARREPPKCEYGPQSEDGARNQCVMLNAAERLRDAAPELLNACREVYDELANLAEIMGFESPAQVMFGVARLQQAIQLARGAK